MRKEKVLIALSAIAVMWALVGCANKMTLRDTFMVPRIEGDPAEISYYRVVLSEFLDVTDTALLFDRGVSAPSLSWKAVIFQKTAKPGKYERIELFATRDIFEPRAFLGIKVPDMVKIGQDDLVAILDHEERLIFNAFGQFIEANYKSVDPAKYGNFFTKISDLKRVIYKKGSVEYDKLIEFSRTLHAVELTRAADAIRKKLGVPAGSVLTQKQLKYIKEKGWDKLFHALLYDNWDILFAYPLLSPEASGAYILVTKIFQVPVYWFLDENGPGRMRRTMTAADTYFMMKWWQVREVQAAPALAKEAVKHPLPDDIKKTIKGTPCEGVETVEEFNECAAKSYAEQYRK